jgi:hypothetical protein
MSNTEIQDARSQLRAAQLARRNHKENIRLMRAATAEAEAAVHACAKELADIAKAEAAADRDRVQRLKAGGEAAAIGAERRAGVERQADLRDDLTGAHAALELLRAELATEEAKTEKLGDELVWATEKVLTAELDETAAALCAEIDTARRKWLEIRAITDSATVPEWRKLYGHPDPVRASRGLRYGRPMQILLESNIAANTVFDKAKFDADWEKWSSYFKRLQADADATMPALGST